MKKGDRFITKGNWNTEPGEWEILESEPDYGRVWCKPITNPGEGESWWSASYVKSNLVQS